MCRCRLIVRSNVGSADIGAERMRREPSIHPFGVLCIGTPNADGGGAGRPKSPLVSSAALRRAAKISGGSLSNGPCPLDHQRVQINQMTNPIRYGVHDVVDRQPAERMADQHPPISWALPPLLCNVDLRSLVLTSNRRIWKCGFRACPGMTETAGAAGGKGSLPAASVAGLFH
jgi:hypothetical protein